MHGAVSDYADIPFRQLSPVLARRGTRAGPGLITVDVGFRPASGAIDCLVGRANHHVVSLIAWGRPAVCLWPQPARPFHTLHPDRLYRPMVVSGLTH